MLLKKHFWLLSMLKTVVLLNIFDTFMNRNSICTVTFDQFNVALQNTIIIFFFLLTYKWWITVYTKILCSTTVFNIDNNQKCVLSSKSAYYYDFWRSCDTEDWSNDAENTALHHRNKLHFNIYSHRKHLFYIVIIFRNIAVLLYLRSNKCKLPSKTHTHKKIIIYLSKCLTSSVFTLFLVVYYILLWILKSHYSSSRSL